MTQSKEKFCYVIITPAKNEANTIGDTIRSVINQTISPAEMIVIDDCSSDDTNRIVKKYTYRVPWLRLIYRDISGPRQLGARVVHTFNYGFNHIQTRNYDFIVKMDADIILSKSYFENLFRKFEKCPELGIAGGASYIRKRGKLIIEWRGARHQVWGGVKTYRKKCFEDIGGLLAIRGWDTIDCIKARMNGWKTMSFKDMKIEHRRLMGSTKGIYHSCLRRGKSQHYMGYRPLYVVAGAILKFFDQPFAIGSLLVLWGFFSSLVQGKERFHDSKFLEYVRIEQIRRLTFR